jgi:ribosomal protein S18 acetylase RimI-like enzyme
MGRTAGGPFRREGVTGIHIRPARREDAEASASLITMTPGGLPDLVGDPRVALRLARSAFTVAGSVGQIIRFSGAEWDRRAQSRTGMALMRAARLRFWRVVREGLRHARVTHPIAWDSLYVISLAVAPDHRSQGVGSALLRRVVEEALQAGLRSVSLDVALRNEGAIRFYQREGFVTVAEGHAPPRRGSPDVASLRMELAL